MNTFTDIFGGNSISRAFPSYAFYSISADTYFVWPFEALDGVDVMAEIVEISATAPGLRAFLPDASVVSVGQNTLFSNLGTIPFTIVDNSGNTIVTIPSGQAWMIYLIDNATSQGAWRSVLLGASSSAANAGALAGFGLRARATQLDQNILTQ